MNEKNVKLKPLVTLIGPLGLFSLDIAVEKGFYPSTASPWNLKIMGKQIIGTLLW
ncbi:MAG: hypothetical protein ACE5G9_07205 [Nitrospinales bacterium]